jgi:hypothetical protein
MESTERIEELLRTKTWKQLTPEERDLVIQELGSELIFSSMKDTDNLLSGTRNQITPHWNILPELRTQYRHQYKNASLWNRVFSFPVPAYAMLFLLSIVAFSGWFIGKNANVEQLAIGPVVVKDTVILKTPADTVYLSRVVYRNRYHIQQPTILSVAVRPSIFTDSAGVTMKDKEELDNLLVSGSE